MNYLGWCSKNGAYFEYFVHLAGSRKEWSEGVDLSHDAPQCPHVNGRVVIRGMKEHLWSTIPINVDMLSFPFSPYSIIMHARDLALLILN